MQINQKQSEVKTENNPKRWQILSSPDSLITTMKLQASGDTVNTLNVWFHSHRPSIFTYLHMSSTKASALEFNPMHCFDLTMVSTSRLEGGTPPTTAWRKANRCHGDRAAKKISLYCYQGNDCGWVGRMGRGESWQEEEEKKGRLGRRARVKITGWCERKEKGWWVVVWGAEIWAQALLFTPSLPCLCWMILNCVGEFTVFCNLIPNKVTQQILLSQMDTAVLFLKT